MTPSLTTQQEPVNGRSAVAWMLVGVGACPVLLLWETA